MSPSNNEPDKKAENEPDKKAKDEPDKKASFPTALTTAIALVVAGLAAIGLTGEPLLRAVRNSPGFISIFVGGAIVGAAIFVIDQFSEPADKYKRRGVILIVLAIIASIFTGAYAVKQRERPQVTLQAVPIAGALSAASAGSSSAASAGPSNAASAGPPSAASAGSKSDTIEITVTARAASLTTNNELMVQVIGLIDDPQSMSSLKPPIGEPRPASSTEAIPWAAVDVCESNHTYQTGAGLDPKVGKVLMWNRIGAKPDGTIEATWKIQIPAGAYSYVCAWAPLGNSRNPNEGAKNSAAYLRLK
jgi:hypothetical protein